MQGYLGAYAPNFTPTGGQSRKDWEADRRARILPRSRIEVGVSDLNITVNGDRATARFRQAYNSDNLNVSSRKTIAMSSDGTQLTVWVVGEPAVGQLTINQTSAAAGARAST